MDEHERPRLLARPEFDAWRRIGEAGPEWRLRATDGGALADQYAPHRY